jgi:hypothetical protein
MTAESEFEGKVKECNLVCPWCDNHIFSSFVAILFARINVRPDIIILLRVGFAFLVH